MGKLTKRQREMIEFLCRQEDFVSVEKLALRFDISERSIRYDLDTIRVFSLANKWRFLQQPQAGVRIQDCDQLLKQLNTCEISELSREERIEHMKMVLLIEKGVTISGLAKKCAVTRQTISSDLRFCEQTFKEFKLDIMRGPDGFKIIGDENDIRTCFTVCMGNPDFYNMYTNAMKENPLYGEIQQLLSALENEMDVEFEEQSKVEIIETLYFSAIRLSRGLLLPQMSGQTSDPKEVIIRRRFEGFISSDTELEKICELIHGARLAKRGGDDINGSDQTTAMEIVKAIKDALGITVLDEDDAIQSLLLHLRATLFRIKNAQRITNPIKEEIKVTLPLFYEVTKEILAVFERQENISFNDDEICFIAMHVAAIYQQHVSVKTNVRIAVVCHSGIATSKILFYRLRNMIPEKHLIGPFSLSEFDAIAKQEEFDFVISTTPIDVNHNIVINPMITNRDMEVIEKNIINALYQKQCDFLIKNYRLKQAQKSKLGDLIKAEHMRFTQENLSWQDAIILAAKPLVENKSISRKYVQKMIWAVETLGTYMVILPQVAFVHSAIDDGVMKNGISLLRLKNPISFGIKNPVDVIALFVIASKTKEDLGLLKIVQILENDKNLEILYKSTDLNKLRNLEDISW